jgi:type IV pilus assembly protein PilC
MAKTSRNKKSEKLSTFIWSASDGKGGKLSGEIQASNMAMAKAQLRKQGIVANKLKKKPIQLGGPRKKPINTADIATMARQLATMMTAGVPLIQSFEIIGRGHENASVSELMADIKADIEGGQSFGEALRKHPKHFDDLFCDLVAAGEQSGALESMLGRIALYKEKSESIKKKIKKAMTYPIAVLVVALIVSAILLIKVVPQFESLFAGFGADLPAFTQMVINLSAWLQSNWYLVGAVIAIVSFSYKSIYQKNKKVRDAQDHLLLKLPVVGLILNKAAIAKFARTLSTTFAAGVPLVEALESAAGASGNAYYRDAIIKVRDDVTSGMQMNLAMASTGVFPNMVVQMVAIGEESGAIDQMLDKVAEVFEEEVDSAVDSMSSLMEPIIMSVLGVLVGGLIIAMYLPIFQMGAAVG